MEAERKSQNLSLEERLLARRKKKEEDLKKEAIEELDNIENNTIQKLKKKLEMEDAGKIIDNFKKKEQEIKNKMDLDKKN